MNYYITLIGAIFSLCFGSLFGPSTKTYENIMIGQSVADYEQITEVMNEDADEASSYLDCVYYGSFTAPNSLDKMVVVKYNNLPHVAGLDTTTLCFFDSNDSFIAETTYSGDCVSITILPSDNGVFRILVIETTCSTGAMGQSVSLLHMENGQLIDEDVKYFYNFTDHVSWEDDHPVNKDIAYVISDNEGIKILISDIYPIESGSSMMVYQWNEFNNKFELKNKNETFSAAPENDERVIEQKKGSDEIKDAPNLKIVIAVLSVLSFLSVICMPIIFNAGKKAGSKLNM